MELFFLAVLIIVMVSALGSGYPVAFALPGSAILTVTLAGVSGYLFAGDSSAYFAQLGPVQWLSAGVTNFRSLYWEAERDTLIAVPLFIFMGVMLQRSRIAEDLLVTMAQLFGPVPGGLGIAVVFVGALLAATTGIVGATVVAMGLISLPAMLKQNYSKALATGTVAASGTLGQIIPPSIVLIILADQLSSAVDQAGSLRTNDYKLATGELSMPSEFGIASTSAGEMFLGALTPGLVLVGVYMLFILVFALLKPGVAPPVPFEGKFDRRFAGKVVLTLVPPLSLIFLVLGSIIGGIATVNQAGAIGAAGALVMAGYRLKPDRKDTFLPAIIGLISLIAVLVLTSAFEPNIRNITTSDDVLVIVLAITGIAGLIISIAWSGWRAYKIDDTLTGVMIETAKTTTMVFVILLGAAMLTAAFRAFGGEELVRDFLNGLPGGFWWKFVTVMVVIFLLGFFLDFIEIAVVVVPIVAPILLADPSANVTAVWLGVMIGLNMQTSFLTPPFGFALFYLRGVAPPSVKTLDMYKGVIAFIGLQLLALVIVGNYPYLVNYLPNRMSLTSDTAPPPGNPRLQYCIEEFVQEQFAGNGDALRQTIQEARGLDYGFLPKTLREEIAAGFDNASNTFALMENIKAFEVKLAAQAQSYRPLHRTVRIIKQGIARIDIKIEKLNVRVDRAEQDSAAWTKATFAITGLEAEKATLESSIPAEWENARTTYANIARQERAARLKYRRASDAAYEPIVVIRQIIATTDDLVALRSRLEALVGGISGMEFNAAMEWIKSEEKRVSAVAGTQDIRSLLAKARRALKGKTPKPDDAAEFLDKAMAAFQADVAWRQRAANELAAKLNTYDAAIRGTIGLRSQPSLPHEQALYVASCSAGHRDISLGF